ncbi:MAG: HipA domain-containing protein [Acidaminococcales bacterium]|jgi:hypothetical protein|nr:HipA domain-containing protein [Acidaminococcales bacterium]
MNYILMNKNTPVISLEIDRLGNIEKILQPYNLDFLPVGIDLTSAAEIKLTLARWWNSRAIPASRDGLNDILAKIGLANQNELLAKGFGLSLSDQYWIKPSEKDVKWKDINFFENDFSEDIGKIAFDENKDESCKNINLISPDNTSDGWLRKKWIIRNADRYLVKAGSDPFRQEPFNEVIAASIFGRLNIPAVQYRLYEVKGKTCSICKNFITSDTELVTAWQLYNISKQPNHKSLYEHLLGQTNAKGIGNARQFIDSMLAVDYLIANTDRHMGNFGFIRNVESLKFISPAPVYDSGTSLWHNKIEIMPGQPPGCRPFRNDHERQIELVKDFGHIDLSKLKGIDEEAGEILKKNRYIDEKRRDRLCYALAHRIEMLRQHIERTKPLNTKTARP